MGGGVPVAAVLEHPRQELVGGLLRAQLRLVVLGRGSSRRDFSSSSEAIRTRNSVEASRSSSPALLEVLEVGDDDLAQRDLGQAHLLAQHDRHQEVERPREDVEVEVELGCSHPVRA